MVEAVLVRPWGGFPVMRRGAALCLAMGLTFTVACATHVLNADLVSMTKKLPPKGPVKKGPPIDAEWCLGDTPAKAEPGKRYGLMDQVILKAQKAHKASYIADASFDYHPWGNCLSMTGRIVK